MKIVIWLFLLLVVGITGGLFYLVTSSTTEKSKTKEVISTSSTPATTLAQEKTAEREEFCYTPCTKYVKAGFNFWNDLPVQFLSKKQGSKWIDLEGNVYIPPGETEFRSKDKANPKVLIEVSKR